MPRSRCHSPVSSVVRQAGGYSMNKPTPPRLDPCSEYQSYQGWPRSSNHFRTTGYPPHFGPMPFPLHLAGPPGMVSPSPQGAGWKDNIRHKHHLSWSKHIPHLPRLACRLNFTRFLTVARIQPYVMEKHISLATLDEELLAFSKSDETVKFSTRPTAITPEIIPGTP